MTEKQRTQKDTALPAVWDLLHAAEAYGIGVSFEPDDEGWRVGYIRGMGGGDLASAHDLTTAARAALRPLRDLHDRLGGH